MSWDEEIVVKKEECLENNTNISLESQKSFKCDRLPKPCSLTFDNIQAKNQHIKDGYGIVGNRLFTCPKPKKFHAFFEDQTRGKWGGAHQNAFSVFGRSTMTGEVPRFDDETGE